MRSFFLLLGVALVFAACEDNGQVTIAQKVDTEKTDTVVLKKTAGLKPKLLLTSKAKETSKNWRQYNALAEFTNQFENITFLDFKDKITKTASLFLQQEQAVPIADMLWPEMLNTPAIRARMLVVETKVKILSTLSFKQSPDIPKIELEITALKNAVQDLNLQINRKFSISPEEMLKEIEKAEKEANNKNNIQSNQPSGKPKIINIKKQ